MAVGIPLSISAFSITLMISVFWSNQLTTSNVPSSARDLCRRNGSNYKPQQNQGVHFWQASVRHVRFANGDPVDSCDKFEYLGVPTSNADTVFRSRLSNPWAAATKLRQSSTLMRMTLLKLVSVDPLLNPYCCTDSNVFRSIRHSRTYLTQHTDVFSAIFAGFTSLTAYPTQN